MTKPFKLTKAELLALEPCHGAEYFGRHKALSAAQAFEAGASLNDLLWVAGKLGMTEKLAEFAKECASRVSHLENADAAGAASWAAYWAARAANWAPAANWAASWAAKAAYWAAAAEAASWAAREAARGAAGAAERKAQKAIFLRIFA